MGRLCWTTLLLGLCLLAPSCEALDRTRLLQLMNDILNVYTPSNRPSPSGGTVTPMFSLALSIPKDEGTNWYNLQQVTDSDPPENVRNMLDKCQVYSGTRVLGATVFNGCPENEIQNLLNTGSSLDDHAEYRVLQNFQTWSNTISDNSKSTDLMVFYVYKSPCHDKCSNPNSRFSILQDIDSIKQWTNFAFVFSHVFSPHGIILNSNFRRKALTNLGNEINGLGNIYKCSRRECISCYAEGAQNQIDDRCVKPSVSRSPQPRNPSPGSSQLGSLHSRGQSIRGQGTRGQGTRGQSIRGQGTRGQGTRGQGTRGQSIRGQGTRGQGTRGQNIRGRGTGVQRPGSPQSGSSRPGSPHFRSSQTRGQGTWGQSIRGQGTWGQSIRGGRGTGGQRPGSPQSGSSRPGSPHFRSSQTRGQGTWGQSIRGQGTWGQSIRGGRGTGGQGTGGQRTWYRNPRGPRAMNIVML